jgi:hypothetical protein
MLPAIVADILNVENVCLSRSFIELIALSTKSPCKSTHYLQSHIEWIREWKKVEYKS